MSESESLTVHRTSGGNCRWQRYLIVMELEMRLTGQDLGLETELADGLAICARLGRCDGRSQFNVFDAKTGESSCAARIRVSAEEHGIAKRRYSAQRVGSHLDLSLYLCRLVHGTQREGPARVQEEKIPVS